jgi:hypothetical protein
VACVGLEREGAEKLRPSSRATPGGLTSERRLSLLLRSRLCGLQWLISGHGVCRSPHGSNCTGDPLADMGTYEDTYVLLSRLDGIAWK